MSFPYVVWADLLHFVHSCVFVFCANKALSLNKQHGPGKFSFPQWIHSCPWFYIYSTYIVTQGDQQWQICQPSSSDFSCLNVSITEWVNSSQARHSLSRRGFAAIHMLIRSISTSASSTYIMVHFCQYVAQTNATFTGCKLSLVVYYSCLG